MTTSSGYALASVTFSHDGSATIAPTSKLEPATTFIPELDVGNSQSEKASVPSLVPTAAATGCSYKTPVWALEEFDLSYAGITELSVAEFSQSLMSLICRNNSIGALDVSMLTELQHIHCGVNSIDALDVGSLTEMVSLSCYINNLTALDVANLTKLTYLQCNNNSIALLDVQSLTSLSYLHCGVNSLSVLDVSGLTSLTHLFCNNNSISVLDVSQLTGMLYMTCNSNNLSVLDLSNMVNLRSLLCHNNSLTTLDVANKASMSQLRCSANDFDQAEFDKILADLDAIQPAGGSGKTLDMSSQTTGAGVAVGSAAAASIASLESKGWLCTYDTI